MRRHIDLMNQMAGAFENDVEQEVIEAIQKDMQQNADRIKDLDLSREELTALIERYMEPLEESGQRLMDAARKKAFNDMPRPGFGPGYNPFSPMGL